MIWLEIVVLVLRLLLQLRPGHSHADREAILRYVHDSVGSGENVTRAKIRSLVKQWLKDHGDE